LTFSHVCGEHAFPAKRALVLADYSCVNSFGHNADAPRVFYERSSQSLTFRHAETEA